MLRFKLFLCLRRMPERGKINFSADRHCRKRAHYQILVELLEVLP